MRYFLLLLFVWLYTFGGPEPKNALAVTMDVYLIGSHGVLATDSVAPFAIETTTVYRLGDFNGNLKATTATLVDNFTFDVEAALMYSSHLNPDASKPTDPFEVGAGTASLFNLEVSVWDDAGTANGDGDADDEDLDASNNIDFGRNASVVFSAVAGGFTDLILAEDGGLNPFSLELCADAECSSRQRIFNGFNSSVSNFLLNLPEFAISDSDVASEMDQVFVFRFSEPILDYVRVIENDDRNFFTNQRLEVDYLGVGSVKGLSPVGPAADYNEDGITNIADYTMWRNLLGSNVQPYSAADGSGNGIVDIADYGVWKMHFGEAEASAVAGSLDVPEPLSGSLLMLVLIALGPLRRLQSSSAKACEAAL
ncbi:hypothetical protein NG895_15705 [Aeoliella sp. ICT_H6.2]|uniref:PEP-CTERM protein-sorting domain-containing protein n=1 Tax=Aeoliella straminimaris TaxID=2954799 RepID=A0A9X2JHE2_9BACT|nr:hypothetical protein [Aeoliella straminimaris]MCO6045357.1 hypothetical protein [Aeoliella straminimaris]